MLERVWRKGNPCIVHGNVNWCNHYGKLYEGFSKKLKVELLFDSAISFLGIDAEYTKNNNNNSKRYTNPCICSNTTYNNIWKQPKCLSIGKYIKKMPYKHTMEHYSITKK